MTAPIRVPEHETISAVRQRLYRRGATRDRQVNAEGERLITASGLPEPGRDGCAGRTAGALNGNSRCVANRIAGDHAKSARRHDRKVARVEHDVVLRLDRATAEDLYVALYELGEHIAAGAPITPPTAEEVERLGRLLRDLAYSIGRKCSPYCDHLE